LNKNILGFLEVYVFFRVSTPSSFRKKILLFAIVGQDDDFYFGRRIVGFSFVLPSDPAYSFTSGYILPPQMKPIVNSPNALKMAPPSENFLDLNILWAILQKSIIC
jgi:hypothetical protein